MRFSREEVLDLAKAWVVLSFAFSVIYFDELAKVKAIIIATVTVGLGFLVHELSHKFLAQYFGKVAEFRAWNQGLGLALILALISLVLGWGVVFAAPGAVIISGYVKHKQKGLISMVGPLSNILLAILFIPIIFIYEPLGVLGLTINAWLALFNLFPFGDLDGMKVLDWNKLVYFALIIAAAALILVPKAIAYTR